MKSLIVVILLNITLSSIAQEEGYATVAAINNNMLMLDNCVDTYKTFKINQKVIVIQKEGTTAMANVQLASNSNNTARQVARKYVVLTITEVERSENSVTYIRVSRDLQSSFIINSSATVEVRVVSCKWNW